MIGCPPTEDLEQLLADQLTPEKEAVLEAHVSQCAACQHWLDERTAPAADDAGDGTPLPASLLSQVNSHAPGREESLPPLTIVDVTREKPSAAEPPLPGYKILGCLGRGGAGVVYRAMHVGLGRIVALKRIQEEGEPSPEQRERFRREAGALAKLRHPNIVQVYDVGEHAGRPYLAMEFVEGGSLAARTSGTPQRSETAALIVEGLARGVHHAHQRGLIHRDLKPANVLLHWVDEVPDRPSCEGCTPKITDFGLVKDLNQGSWLTETRDILGTPSYMAPEQAQGSGNAVGPLVDVWALGAVLYELLTCRPPFVGESVLDTLLQVRFNEPVRPARLQPKVPRPLETICLKCLEKEPINRYVSAAALADDLRRHLDGRPIHAQPPSVASRVWRWCRRNPGVAGLSAAVFLLLLLVLSREAILRAAAETRAREAVAARGRANQLAESESNLRRDAEQRSLHLTLEKAWSLPEQGQIAEGMLWLVRCLEIAPADDVDLQQAIRANLAAWNGRIHPLRQLLLQGGPITALASSPAGKRLASSTERSVRLFDLVTGEPIGAPLAHEAPVQSLAFSSDGTRLVAATITPAIYTWDMASGEMSGAPLRNPDWVGTSDWRYPAVVLSSDGAHALVKGKNDTAQLWETSTGKSVGRPLPVPFYALTFSADGLRFVAGSGSTAQVWDLSSEHHVGKPLVHSASIDTVHLNRNGSKVVVGGEDITARLWDVARGEPFGASLRHQESVLVARFSPGGSQVVTGGLDRMARLWDAATGEPTGPPIRHLDAVDRAAFSPDGRILATGSRDGLINIHEVSRRQPHVEPLKQRQALLAVGFSPKGGRAVTACWDGTAQEWDLATHKPVGGPLGEYKNLCPVTVYSPDGSRILTARWDGTAQQWDAVTRQPVGPAMHHEDAILAAAYSPDGSKILTGSQDKTAQLWEAATGRSIGKPLPHTHSVHAVAFHPDGDLLLTGSYDRTACVWDAHTQQRIEPPFPHTARVSDVAFSPDGSKVLTATQDGVAQLWDLGRKPVGQPMRHAVTIRRAAFSPDGQRIVTASHDGTARIWDVATQRSLGTPLTHAAGVKAVAFSPDGQHILTGDADGRAWLWDAPPPCLAGDPEQLKLWVQVVTGQELREDGQVQQLDFSAWHQRRQRLFETIIPAARLVR
jgi:WD40 repeat protein/serine/threonine protein kinase